MERQDANDTPERGHAAREWARHWSWEPLPGLDLLRARYIRHAFPRHSHEGYTLGAVTHGVERVELPGTTLHAGPGTLVMVNPEVAHAARAGTPEGWAYATLYPSLGLVREVADATGHPPGTPVFDRPLADDARSGRLVRAVHRAVEQGDALAADTLLRVLLSRLLNLYGTTAPRAVPASAGRGTAARARLLLEERLTDPPSLEELAQTLGSSPFAVLRAFKAAYGMPPHTWLTDARVRRARALLRSGATPAETATAVGFTDQPHLNRHFTRIVGVTPGAYRRARRAG
ncbi:AraC family transcriptional regulator [Streptomyces koyangensis]|uniref:AraC family transcriptional regulator n=1 Tax=Streptomyces koyangensis TaxID=188770 RepID=UPI00345215B0